MGVVIRVGERQAQLRESESGREGERARARERETDRQKDRQTDRLAGTMI
jgi:hypothetical protein